MPDVCSLSHVPTVTVPVAVRPEAVVPEPMALNQSRYFFHRHDVENFKRQLAGLPVVAKPPPVVELVSVAQFARELGVCKVTVKRWVRAARRAREAAEAKAEAVEPSAAPAKRRTALVNA
jgi:hypothetical protein